MADYGAVHKFVNLTIVWGYGCVGVWEKKTLPHAQPPILPHRMETEPNVELHKLMHASVKRLSAIGDHPYSSVPISVPLPLHSAPVEHPHPDRH